MRFLLVEDYPSIQDIYKEVFEGHGHSVEVVNDGEQALKKLETETYDLIGLDILLPNMDGVEFLKALKAKSDKLPKILVLSDFDKPELVEEVKAMGVLDYLIKVEYTPQELVKLMEKYATGKLPKPKPAK